MKNKYYVYLVFLVLIASILIVTGLIFYKINNTLNRGEPDLGIIVSNKIPRYHFAMVYKDMDEAVWFTIKKGVERAAKDFNVAVEFSGTSIYDEKELEKCLDIAMASKVDGIVTYVWDEVKTSELIDKAVEQGIPVVTIGTDAKESKRAVFVGENTYNSGIQLGRLISSATGDMGEAVILKGSNQNGEVMTQSLMVLGIYDALEQYPDIDVKVIEYDSSSFIGIEEAVTSLLESNSEVNTIVCTSTRDTVILVERLIDLNKVGYNIIGYGNSPEILGYIEREVIFGTIAIGFEKMGYDTIKALVDLKNQGRATAYFKPETYVITRKNISKYLNIEEE